MRVSECFIAAVAELEEYTELTEGTEVLDYSNIYSSQTLEELEKMLEGKTFEKIACQEFLPAIPLVDIENIKEMLKLRIQKIK